VLSLSVLIGIGILFLYGRLFREIFDIFCYYETVSDIGIHINHCSMTRAVSLKGLSFLIAWTFLFWISVRIALENGLTGFLEFILFYTGIFSFLFGVYHVYEYKIRQIPFVSNQFPISKFGSEYIFYTVYGLSSLILAALIHLLLANKPAATASLQPEKDHP
jgi:hypothetical protein